jgi:hypothetical protein
MPRLRIQLSRINSYQGARTRIPLFICSALLWIRISSSRSRTPTGHTHTVAIVSRRSRLKSRECARIQRLPTSTSSRPRRPLGGISRHGSRAKISRELAEKNGKYWAEMGAWQGLGKGFCGSGLGSIWAKRLE